MQSVITSNPDIMHREPCFEGTRVTARTFFDQLQAGYSLDAFLKQFPSVRREQVAATLDLLREERSRIATAA